MCQRSLKGFLLTLVIGMFTGLSAFAQITTTTITGHISDGKNPVPNAVITVMHVPSGTPFYALSNDKGIYVIQNVVAGGPYVVRVERLNYVTMIVSDVTAPLGGTVEVDVVIAPSATRLLNEKSSNMLRLTWSLQNEPRSFLGGEFPTVDILEPNTDTPTEQVFPTFNHTQVSLYAQDEMKFSKFFELSVGLRLEIPFIRFLHDNVEFDQIASAHPNSSFGGLSTADYPVHGFHISPRIGFNWDITHKRSLILRGGTGLFTGRIPNVWLVSAIGNSNCLQYQYIANNHTLADLPGFNEDRDDIISSLYIGHNYSRQGLPAPTNATILAKDLKMPTSWKTSLSLDILIPSGIKTTIEGIYSFNLNEVCTSVLGYKEDGTIELPGEPILTPFPDIAAHVEDTQFIGCLDPDIIGAHVAVVIIPRYLRQIVAAGITGVGTFQTATRGVLPLRLARQGKTIAFRQLAGKVLVEAVHKSLAFRPAHALHGKRVALSVTRVVVTSHHRHPLRLCDFRLADVEIGQSHRVSRCFRRFTTVVAVFVATQLHVPSFHKHHLEGDVVHVEHAVACALRLRRQCSCMQEHHCGKPCHKRFSLFYK